MAATIEVNGLRATIDEYVWTGEDEILVDALNSFIPDGGPRGYDPNPDRTMAYEMAKLLKGKVVNFDQTDPAPDGVN